MRIDLPKGTYSTGDLAELAKAFEAIERILPKCSISLRETNGEPERRLATQPPGPRVAGVSPREFGIRAKVFAATKESHKTVEQIVAETGLETSQVRGVINAPGLKFDVQTADDGMKAYKRVPAKPVLKPAQKPTEA